MTLRRLQPDQIDEYRRDAVDETTLREAAAIVDDVRRGGEPSLRKHARTFGELGPDGDLVIGPDVLARALTGLPADQRAVLERTAARIEDFAFAQRNALSDITVPVPGGEAGHSIAPVERAGCYAPGGRYPLPSSVLMTAVTARAAGVAEIWVASPRPAPITLAAAAVAGVDGLLAVGGAHAIAALAYGVGGPARCDVVVGPGNRWVTAAKKVVAGDVGIDMLAGPSELVILAGHTADAEMVAADLLAQAEHDPDALPVLVTTDDSLAEAVDAALERQLVDLPTREVADAALRNGFTVVAADLEEAATACNRLAPEHLQVLTENAGEVARRLSHYGGLFIGSSSAEVFGDYGIGPNHTLPTGGVARYKGGLSVFDFLRVRTWLRMDDGANTAAAVADAAALARLEGLEAHARAAERRIAKRPRTRHQ
jgi:phosphoribosyl-ATP pyrophosphohydrolase/phosphoribosyl-AMP cyclohydrolase/histidinol dehydrogenase